jgi:anti-sigma factor RsiW
MNPQDQEHLLAFVDGELDAAQAAEVAARLERDAEAAAFVGREQALRQRLQAAFAPVMDEPVPERLMAALQAVPSQPMPMPSSPERLDPASRPGWGGDSAAPLPLSPSRRLAANAPRWIGLAAALLIGIGIGRLWLAPGGEGPPAMLATGPDGTLVAGPLLAQALSSQPSGAAPAHAPLQVAWTFRDHEGRYCRTFVLATNAAAGLACRDDGGWRVQVVARADDAAPAAAGAYRQAASALPNAVLQAVDTRIEGQALDAAAEAEALKRGFAR